MKKILITGGAGFIGSHLCKRLINKNNHIICVDNLFTGSKNNIKDLLPNPNFEFIEHDIINPLNIDSIDEIYNLACPASPVSYQQDAIKTIKTCIIGTFNMIELAEKVGAKILQASTSEVYGNPSIHPQPESYWGSVNPIGIRSCYDEGKRCAETICFDWHRQTKLKVKIIRIFNTYGPNMMVNDGRVVSNFINQALNNENITIYGDGSQTRSFQYIDDLIDAMIKVMNTDDNFIGPVNIGNPHEFTILELAQLVIKKTNSKSSIIYQPLPSDDPYKRKPDISLAKEVLKWEPKVQLSIGLEKVIEYFRNIKN